MDALGAGVDIIAVSRMRQVLENPGSKAFIRKVYTAEEVRRSELKEDSVSFLARIFAAKEAVFKTFGIAASEQVQLREVEIREGKFGQPEVVLTGYFAELARERRVEKVLLSISYDGEYAIAMAVLQGSVIAAAEPCRKGRKCDQTKYFRRKQQSPSVELRDLNGVER